MERGAPGELVWITHPRLPAPPPHAHSRGRGPAPCFLPLLTLRPLVFRGLEARPGRRPIRESGLCPFLRPRQLPREPGPGGRRPRGCAERPRGPASGKGPSTASGPPGRTGPRLRVWAPRGTLGHPGRPGGSPSSPPWALVCAAGALPPPRLVPHGDLRFHSRGSPWARPGLCEPPCSEQALQPGAVHGAPPAASPPTCRAARGPRTRSGLRGNPRDQFPGKAGLVPILLRAAKSLPACGHVIGLLHGGGAGQAWLPIMLRAAMSWTTCGHVIGLHVTRDVQPGDWMAHAT